MIFWALFDTISIALEAVYPVIHFNLTLRQFFRPLFGQFFMLMNCHLATQDSPEWYQLHLATERIRIPEILFQVRSFILTWAYPTFSTVSTMSRQFVPNATIRQFSTVSRQFVPNPDRGWNENVDSMHVQGGASTLWPGLGWLTWLWFLELHCWPNSVWAFDRIA